VAAHRAVDVERALGRQVEHLPVGRGRDAGDGVGRHALVRTVQQLVPLAGRRRPQLGGAEAEHVLAGELQRRPVVVGDLAGTLGADQEVALAGAAGGRLHRRRSH